MTYVPAIIDDDMIAAFFYLGYYGKGPSVLPTSCKVTDTDDEGTNVQTYSCSYTLNSDGTVNTFNGIENGTMIYDNKTASGSETAAKSVMITSFPQLFYPLVTRQFFCDFHEKSEDFCVS